MYTMNIYTCQLKKAGDDRHSSGRRGRRQTESLRFWQPSEVATIWNNLEWHSASGATSVGFLTSFVSQDFYRRRGSANSYRQFFLASGIIFAPEMTRTSDLRFRKTTTDRVGVRLSTTHRKLSYIPARSCVNRSLSPRRSSCHGLHLLAGIGPIYLTSFISHICRPNAVHATPGSPLTAVQEKWVNRKPTCQGKP